MNKLLICLFLFAETLKPAGQAPSHNKKWLDYAARGFLANENIQQPTEQQVQHAKNALLWSIWWQQQTSKHVEKLKKNQVEFCTIL